MLMKFLMGFVLAFVAFAGSTYTPPGGTGGTSSSARPLNPQVAPEVAARALKTFTGTAGPGTSLGATAMAFSPELGTFCAVGSNALIASSPDGTTWTTRTGAIANATLRDIVWVGELRLFVVGSSGAGSTRIQTSPDCVTWTANAAASPVPSVGKVKWVPELGKLLAFPTEGSNLGMTSTDGLTWTSVTLGTQNRTWSDFAWSPTLRKGVLVVSGVLSNNTSVTTTTDLSTFTETPHGLPIKDFRGVAWSSELKMYAAAAFATDTTVDTMVTSPDAVNWSPRYRCGNDTCGFMGVSAIPELGAFIGYTISGPNRYSTDGITWTASSFSSAGQGIPTFTWVPQKGAGYLVFSGGTGNRLYSTKYVGKMIAP